MEIKDNAHRLIPSEGLVVGRRKPASQPPHSLEQYRRVARAIKLGDTAGAEEAMRHHLATLRDTQLLTWQPELQGRRQWLSTVARPESVYASAQSVRQKRWSLREVAFFDGVGGR